MTGSFDLPTVTAAGSALAATATGVWALMQGQVKHWKDVHDAKERELESSRKQLEDARRDPVEIAKKYIENQEAILMSQLARFHETIDKLKEEIKAKDEKIGLLQSDSQKDQERIVFLAESKQVLERKIQAYEEMIQEVIRRREIANETFESLSSDAFVGSDLAERIKMELDLKLNKIDATSYSKTWAATSASVQQAATAKAARLNKYIEDKSAAEKKAEARFKQAMHIATDIEEDKK